MKIRAILNPRAGVAAERARRAILDGPWPDVDLIETRAAGHAKELAAEAVRAGCEIVLAAGGDGTANEVAWGLLGSETALGLVPVGSGNGLARSLRIPLEPRAAVRRLHAGLVRRMDVGFWDGRPFLNVGGAGFDAVVGADFHAHGKGGGRRGVLTYVRLSLRRVFSYEAARYRVSGDGGSFEGKALVVAVSNGRQYGGGATIAPRARLDDGALDVVIFEDAPTLSLVAGGPRLFLGTVDRFAHYRHFTTTRLEIAAPEPFLHHRDGEPEAEGVRSEIHVEARALRVLVPRAAAEDPDGPFELAP